MIILREVLIAIIGGILTTIVLYMFKRFYKRYRYCQTNKIMPLNKGVEIIVSSHQAKFDFENFENLQPRIVVTAESVRGISKLFKLYSQYDIEPIISIDKCKEEEKRAGIEICIGASSANNRTKYYLKNYIPTIFNEVGGEKTVLPNNARIIKLTVYKTLTEVEEDRMTIFLIYGYYTSDTVAAMRFFSDNFCSIKRILSHNFCSIFLQTTSESGLYCERIIRVSNDISDPIQCPEKLETDK